MSFFVFMNYGPGYLDFFLDLFSIVLLFDLAALAILTFIFWKKRSVNGARCVAGFDNPLFITKIEKKNVKKGFCNASTQTTKADLEQTLVIEEATVEASNLSTKLEGADSAFLRRDIVNDGSPNVPKTVEKTQTSSPHRNVKPHHLEKRQSREDIVFQSGWRKTVTLEDLVRANVILESRVVELEEEKVTKEEIERELKPYLVGQYPIAGIYNDQTGEKMSLFNAYKAGIVSRGTALGLLEAQAGVGSIIDPLSGEKMSVSEALQKNLLDRQFAAVLARAERAVIGFKVKGTDESLSLFQAMKRGLVVENHGIRLLEAQIATGGIIDPVANHRLPVEKAFERGLFDEQMHAILDDPTDDTKGFLDPNTNENLTYLELIKRCVIDPETKLMLLPLVREEERNMYKTRKTPSVALRERILSSVSSDT